VVSPQIVDFAILRGLFFVCRDIMVLMIYIYWVTSILLNASANILFKVSAKQGFSQLQGVQLFSFLKENSILLTGVSLFAFSTVTYFLTLRALPVSTVYPVIVGMSFVITNSIAYFYLHEKIYGLQVIGYVFIVIGVAIVFSLGTK
jgi:multidrug transporter EmrE-like cation transporter